MGRMERWNKTMSLTISDGEAETEAVEIKTAAGGQIKFPAGCTSPATWEAKTPDGSWAAIHDDSDAAVSSAFTADKWRPIPENVIVHDTVRAVVAGNVSGAKTVELVLKA